MVMRWTALRGGGWGAEGRGLRPEGRAGGGLQGDHGRGGAGEVSCECVAAG